MDTEVMIKTVRKSIGDLLKNHVRKTDVKRELNCALEWLEQKDYDKSLACVEVADLFGSIPVQALQQIRSNLTKLSKENSHCLSSECLRFE